MKIILIASLIFIIAALCIGGYVLQKALSKDQSLIERSYRILKAIKGRYHQRGKDPRTKS
jgi:hypothetical protein